MTIIADRGSQFRNVEKGIADPGESVAYAFVLAKSKFRRSASAAPVAPWECLMDSFAGAQPSVGAGRWRPTSEAYDYASDFAFISLFQSPSFEQEYPSCLTLSFGSTVVLGVGCILVGHQLLGVNRVWSC